MRARVLAVLVSAVVLNGCPVLLSDWQVAYSVGDASVDASGADGISGVSNDGASPSAGGDMQLGSGGAHTSAGGESAVNGGTSSATGDASGRAGAATTGKQPDSGGQPGGGGAAVIDASDTSNDSGTCITDLSNTLGGDFHVLFEVLATSGSAPVDDGPLLEQRAICDPYSEHWVVAEQATRIIVEIGDGTNLATVTSVGAIDDGVWHDVVVARVAGTLSVTVDGKLDNSVPDSTHVSIGPLALLQVGRSSCTQQYAGQIRNICLRRP